MKSKFIWFSVIMFGLMMIFSAPFYAQEVESSPADLAEIAANRDAVMDEIVETWSAEAEGWEEQFGINVSMADDNKLLALRNAVDFDEVIAILDSDMLEHLGDTSSDLVYTPVTPCKIVDTRYGGGGFIAAGSTRNYQTYGSLGFQGGSSCSSPRGEPSAVHLSVVVVTPNGQGNIKTHPYLTSSSTGLAVNFANIGTNLANAGTVGVTRYNTYDISVSANNAGAHVTIQVLGYYYPVDENDFKVKFAGSRKGTATNLTVAGGCTNYSQVSIWVPGSGKVKVDAQAMMRLWSHTKGQTDDFYVFLSSSPTNCQSYSTSEGYNFMEWGVHHSENSFTSLGLNEKRGHVSLSRTFSASSSGTKSFYLNGSRHWGSASGGFASAAMQAVYYPNF